jgi:hypothetical protein
VTVAINLEVATERTQLAELSQCIVAALAPAVDELSSQAGLPDMNLNVRITDHFVAEIDSQRRSDLPSFTTSRLGGDAVARCHQAETIGEPHSVLINAAVFDQGDTWLLSHVPQVLAHELGHCLLGQSRLVHGTPSGYVDCPVNPIQALGYTSLTACDEYIADRIGHMLIPPVGVDVENEGSVIPTTDRMVLGTSRLTTTLDELDAAVHPRLSQMVLAYRQSGEGLNELVESLIPCMHESMVMYAHYKAATRDLPDVETLRVELDKVSSHPGTRLLLDPFWDAIEDHMERRFAKSPLLEFREQDQICLDRALGGLEEAWAALGVSFEAMPGDAVFVHISDPLD